MLIRRTMLTTLIFILSFGFFLEVGATTTDYTPTVKVKKIKDTSVTLQIISTNLKRKDVKIKVKIENIDTDGEDTKIFEKTLNKNGKTDISVDGLTKDNEYSFKVAIKKTSDSSYSSYADEKTINAEGTFNYSPTLSIEDETNSTVVLSVASTKLKKKKVKIKIRIENKDTDKIETRVFSKTLSKNGKIKITIDNLSKDTEYAFKALVKKSKDNGFSGYSNEESTTTED